MNNRKQFLAFLRNGNYAHAGEEEAIDLTLELVSKNPNQKILDIGCGLGGTANYIETKGYGNVIGIDIDTGILEQAKELYPNLKLYNCDANTANVYFKDQKFNVFCSFNAFFCFQNQENCLSVFSDIADDNAELLIFDYSSPTEFLKPNPFSDQTGVSTAAASFKPINLSIIEKSLNKTNWTLNIIVNLNDKYRDWYQSIIIKMDNHKNDLIKRFGHTTFYDLYLSFNRVLELINQKELGGSIINARLKPR